jgi:hypothetical protein
MEEYLPPERRKQWQDAPIVEVSFFLDGKKKTYVGYEAGIIERATVAAIRSDEAVEEEAALAHYQVHAFNLGGDDGSGKVTTCPKKRSVLASFLIGLDTRRSKVSKRVIHSARGNTGFYCGQRLAGMYERWDDILIREDRESPDAINFVTRCVNAKTAPNYNGGPEEHVFGNPQSSMVADSGDEGEEKNDWEPVTPAARIGFTGAAEVKLELTERDIDSIIKDLEAWGPDGERTARLLRLFLDGKLTPNHASLWGSAKRFNADYQFFRNQRNNSISKLQCAIQRRKSNMIEFPVAERAARPKGKRTIRHPLFNPTVLCCRGVTYTLAPQCQYKPGWKDGPFLYLDEKGRAAVETAFPERF